MALQPHELKALAIEIAAALPPADPARAPKRPFKIEDVLYYVEAALEAHRQSFSADDERNRKLQWAVTGLLEHAEKMLSVEVYGERA